MSSPASRLSVLAIDAEGLASVLVAQPGVDVLRGDFSRARDADVVLMHVPDRAALTALAGRPGLAEVAYDQALVVATGEADEAAELDLLRLGVEGVVGDADPAEVVRALRHAQTRKQVEHAARTAYATDLATGLPHQAQLLEHMAHLIALREREPAPLVLIVLRIEGVAQAAAHLGGEAANVLRRKVAVRLRGGLRASDVVASLGTDLFAVLLGRVDMVGDGDGVAAKLLRGLEQPFILAGQPCTLKARFGLASYPMHGKDPTQLLQRATAQAAMLATVGEDGVGLVHSSFVVLGGGAANDDEVGALSPPTMANDSTSAPKARVITLRGATNFRDLGGYAGRDGRRLRWRRLFRSDHLGALAPEDHAVLSDLGVAAAFDFRGRDERAAAPYDVPGLAQHALPIEPTVAQRMQEMQEAGQGLDGGAMAGLMRDLYRSLVSRQAPRFAQLFRHILADEPPGGAIVFHCTAGKDRTGVAAALLLLALGVPRSTVMEDYLLTNEVFKPPWQPREDIDPDALRALWGVQPGYLEAAFEVIDQRFGGTERYLREQVGLDDERLGRLARRYLE